jgi:hypothetical protein
MFRAADKMRIVLAGLRADTKIFEPCRREGISDTQFDQRKGRLARSAAKVFEDTASGPTVGVAVYVVPSYNAPRERTISRRVLWFRNLLGFGPLVEGRLATCCRVRCLEVKLFACYLLLPIPSLTST